MISNVAFPDRFTEIDELTRPDHFWLTVEDRCYFLGEYTARRGYAYSQTNNLILNFKKTLDRRGKPEWRYKKLAIRQAAAAFRRALGQQPPRMTFVPIPPSKAPQDPLYDDRVTQMLRAIWPAQPADVREIIIQPESTDAAHDSLARPTPLEIAEAYRIDDAMATPRPESIAVVDECAHDRRTFPGRALLADGALCADRDRRVVHCAARAGRRRHDVTWNHLHDHFNPRRVHWRGRRVGRPSGAPGGSNARADVADVAGKTNTQEGEVRDVRFSSEGRVTRALRTLRNRHRSRRW